jgi:parallel beta-helix repeat protein
MNLLSLILAPFLLANTWVVDSGGGGDFLTIQEAINASVAGDVIQVTPGTYEEDLIVNVSVTIEGIAGGTVTIYPATSNVGSGVGGQIDTTTQSCIIEAHDVTLRDLVFNGNNPNLSADIDARNGIIANYLNGPWDRLTVEDCNVRNIWLRAIYCSLGTGHLIRNNTVRNAKAMALESSGIMLWAANGVVENNVVKKCSIGITNHNSSSGDIFNNTVSDCDLGVLTNGSNGPTVVYNNSFTDCVQGHQLIGLRTDVTSRNNTFLRSKWAYTFFGSTGSGFIEDNIIDGGSLTDAVGLSADTDLAPWGTNDVLGTVKRNQFVNLKHGVLLEESAASRSQTMGLVFGGSALDANSFSNVSNMNMKLVGCNDNIAATFNSWGLSSAASIEDKILHQVDDPALGLVDFSGWIAGDVYVDANGGAEFLTIQEGIDAVVPGGTVFVAPGDYVESLVVNKALTISGSGADSNPTIGTNIFGDNAASGIGNDVVSVIADNVIVENVRVDAWSTTHSARYGAAIIFVSTNGGTVRDVAVERGTYGIYSFFANGTTLENNLISDCGVSTTVGGGVVYHGSTGTVGGVGLGNSALDCLGVGYLSTNSSATTMTDNLARNCEIGYMSSGASGTTVFQGNGANACDQGFQGIANNAPVDFLNNTVQSRPWETSGFSLFGNGSGSYLVSGNVTDGSGAASFGLYINPNTPNGSSDIHVVVRDNTFLDARQGIYLDESGGNTFLVDVNIDGTIGGHNRLAGQQLYSIYLNNCNDSVEMQANYWGTLSTLDIEARIFDSADAGGLGTVNFAGPLAPSPDLRVEAIHRSANYKVQAVVTGNPGDTFRLIAAQTQGSWVTPFGTLGIDQQDAREILSGVIPASGIYMTRIEAFRAPLGTWYAQAVVFDSVSSITNLETITLRDLP